MNVRFIAATHRDLVEFVARGWFREDLYFRLAVLPVRVPPLRERMEDLELLVQRFLGESAASLVTPALIAELGLRKWRGNVRELRNVLDRARAFGIGAALAIEEGSLGDPSAEVAARAELADAQTPVPATKRLPGDTATNQSGGELVVPPPLLALTHREFRERWSELGERSYLAQQLEKHGGNVSKVAREIELARTYAHKLIKKHGF